MPEADLLRPKTPLPGVPSGWMVLEGYSSLGRYWGLLRGLERHGYGVEVPARAASDQCRRSILGVRYPGAGGLLDAEALRAALLDEDGGLALEVFNLEPGAQGLLNALLDGDKVPLQRALSEHYSLDFDLVLGFTAARQLALKAGGRFWPLDELRAPLPLELPLKARRLGREEYRVLLERLAGGGPRAPPSGRMAAREARVDYRSAGVDIEAGNRAVALMRAAVRSTHTAAVLGAYGGFGGAFDASSLAGMRAPVLVASTDGVGTKTRLAARLGRYRGLGLDIVNHCLNDILVQGARPLLFLDYVAMPRLVPEVVAEIVEGAAEACRAGGCALLGGETAEMPGVYAEGELDLVGTVVGSVEREEMIDGSSLVAGDAVLGLPSSGLHTNGYSLARRALENADLGADRGGATLGERLLAPHRSYLPAFEILRGAGVGIKAMAHVTGGGLVENPPRVFPPGLGAVLFEGSWPVPPIFREIVERGAVEPGEARRAFNMGLGMLVFVGAGEAEAALAALQAAGEAAYRVGETVPGSGVAFA